MSADPDRIRILCVDDHPVVRQGIVGLVLAAWALALGGCGGGAADVAPSVRSDSFSPVSGTTAGGGAAGSSAAAAVGYQAVGRTRGGGQLDS